MRKPGIDANRQRRPAEQCGQVTKSESWRNNRTGNRCRDAFRACAFRGVPRRENRGQTTIDEILSKCDPVRLRPKLVVTARRGE